MKFRLHEILSLFKTNNKTQWMFLEQSKRPTGMEQRLKKMYLLHWSVFFICMLYLNSVFASPVVGKVLSVKGAVHAVSEGQETRALERRSEVHVGEILKTGEDSNAQIRMLDGAIIALQSNTEFKVESYQSGKTEANEFKSSLKLLKGGFRTLTGSIADHNPDAYQVTTEVATMGVRGTFWGAVFGSGSVTGPPPLNVSVWNDSRDTAKQSGVWIKNDSSEIEIGPGRPFNHAFVPSSDQPVQGRTEQSSSFESGAVGDSGGSGEGSSKSSEQSDSGSSDQSNQQLSESTAPASQTQTNVAPPAVVIVNNDISTLAGSSTTFGFLTEAEKGLMSFYGAAGLTPGDGTSNLTIFGKSTDGSTGSPVIGNGITTSTVTQILRKGTAPLLADFPSSGLPSGNTSNPQLRTIAADENFVAAYGAWGATSSTPAPLINFDGSGIPITHSVFWGTAPLSPDIPTSGSIVFEGNYSGIPYPLFFKGRGTAGNVTAFHLKFTANFNGQVVPPAGSLFYVEDRTGGTYQQWSGSGGVSGTINNGTLDLSVSNNNGYTSNLGDPRSGEPFSGKINAVVTGPCSDAVVGVFSLKHTGDSSRNVQGVFGISQEAN